jgi:hypothetical protein
VTVAVLVLTVGVVGARVEPAAAVAAGSDFQAGDIISDALFFNGASMTAGDVQAFLAAKKPTPCTGGTTCLKDYRAASNTRAAEVGMCAGYQGSGSESAAEIIAKVGVSCGVSQAVLLVAAPEGAGPGDRHGPDRRAVHHRDRLRLP